jgi:PAS domain S-box-containing protein
MNWITIAWSMNSAVCLTLAGIYFVIWCKQRENWVHLLFSFSAVAAAALSAFELWMMNATTVEQYQSLVRWVHLLTWVLTVSFVAFVRLYLHAGRRWLASSIYSLRTLVLILSFIFPVSINFRAITNIHHLSWAGEMISVPVGVPNPWGLISSLSLLLLLIFSVDATITVWRRGDRRRALLVGGSMIFGAILAWHVPLVIWGFIEAPFFLGFTYTAIVLAMGYELSNGMLHAAQLAQNLKESEQRLDLAASSANFGVWDWDLSKDQVWVMRSRRVLFGFPAGGELRFADLISRVHVDDRDRIRQAINDAIKKRKVYDAEFRMVLPDGRVRWIAARGTVEADRQGKPARMLGVSIDVTAQREASLEAQRLRQQRTLLLDREVAERARLEREVIESCTHEQRRIAYDLHDGVGQQLVGVALSAKLLEEQLRAERSVEADMAAIITKLANEAARQTRLTARTLEGADGVGDLKAALGSLATNMSQNCSVKITVTADSSSLPISAPVAAELYRIAQEAVRNAIEHGAAHDVKISLFFDGNDLVLTIQDDGKGFEANRNGNGNDAGMGLRIMRYRAQCIGGACEVESSRDKGTMVSCRVSLEAQPATFDLP